ncbi:ricin-type beta-trefoil lectin domain protein [Streptomyces chartreusis]|uniref:ricin-type beta-trefoil lectin domain protein n=1 Tax=Streptomyces chartreusis TaxID=1969 RepID=UPI00380B41A7
MSERPSNSAEDNSGSASAARIEGEKEQRLTSEPTQSTGPEAPTRTVSSSGGGTGPTTMPAAPTPPASPDPVGPSAASLATALQAGPEAATRESDASQGVVNRRLSPGGQAAAALAGLLLIAVPFAVAKLSSGAPASGHPPKSEADLVVPPPRDDARAGFVPVPEESSTPSTRGPHTSAKPTRSPEAAPHHAVKAPRNATGGTKKDGNDSGSQAETSRLQASEPPASEPRTSAPRAYVYLVSQLNGRCVDIPHHKPVLRVQLQVWDCKRQDGQRWTFHRDGTVRDMGLCMRVKWRSGQNGSPIDLIECANHRQQKWVLTKAGQLVNPATKKCVDIINARPQNGTRLQLWSCNGQSNQKWKAV